VKWVVLCLVLANAAFFGWQLSRDREVVVASEAVPATPNAAMVNRLLLVNEVDPGVLRRRRSSPLGVPAAESEAPPPAQTAATDSGSAPPALEEVLAMPQNPDIACYTIGPLENEDDISALGAWFNAQGSQATLRDDERREVVSTWVFVPPQESLEAAKALVQEMEAASIEDIYVIARGDMANAISLGLYSQSETLERRVAQLESRGFTPSVQPRYRTATASWFDVTTSTAQPMTVGVLDQIFPDLVIRQVACGDAPIAGDPAITYNSSDLRQEGSYSDNATGAALEASGRSGTQ
jgi:hypothetical protein